MMPNTGNPYTPGEPAGDPSRFFGRGDLLVSVREQLVRERRVVLVSGASRIGKTSFLRRVASELPDAFFPVMVSLAEGPITGIEGLERRLAQSVVCEIAGKRSVALPEPAWEETGIKAGRRLPEFWPRVRSGLGDRIAVLLLDDLDCLRDEPGDPLGPLCDLLVRLRRQDERLAFVITVGSGQVHALEEEYPALFAGAFSAALGPLPNEDAIRLITQPAEGHLTYDQGVPRRLVEVTSGHPHYLQLVCSAIFERCAGEGWVNQHDVDLVLEDLASREIPQFRQLWDESSPQEQAVLAALTALRGARGVATAAEVHGLLARAGAQATPVQVLEAFEELSRREVVERLGALSYRLRVALLRDWLRKRFDLQEAMASARWEPRGRKRMRGVQRAPARSPREQGKAGPDLAGQPTDRRSSGGLPAASDAEAGPAPRRHVGWGWLAPLTVVCIALLVIAIWSLRSPGAVAPTATIQAVALPTSRPTKLAIAPATRDVQPTSSPTPTEAPTPTAPVITTRSLPAIAYLSKPRAAGLWTIYLMGSDGSNRIPVIEASSDFVSAPSWSPRGDRLAFVSDRDGSADIWVVDREGREPRNLTHDRAKDNCPAWSPDGEWIAFSSVRDSVYWELYVMRTNGSEVRRLTWWEDASDLWPSWSPDGSRLAFASKRDGNWEIYTIAAHGGDLARLTDNPADDMHPSWSPDGQWIGFDSLRDGYADVYVVRALGGDARNLTRLAWASDLGPTWSPDGSRLAFYSDRDGNWDVYTIAADGSDVVRLTTQDTQDQLPAWRP